MMSGEFQVTEDFIERYIEWYIDYSTSDPPFEDYRFAGYLERRPTHLLKLCMIVSASHTSSRVIKRVDFERALMILELTEKKMPLTFSGVGKSNTADVMQRVIAVISASKEIEFGELLTRFYQDIDKFILEKMVDSLHTMGKIEVLREGGKTLIKSKDKLRMS
jgi:hypothetical protein